MDVASCVTYCSSVFQHQLNKRIEDNENVRGLVQPSLREKMLGADDASTINAA